MKNTYIYQLLVIAVDEYKKNGHIALSNKYNNVLINLINECIDINDYLIIEDLFNNRYDKDSFNKTDIKNINKELLRIKKGLLN